MCLVVASASASAFPVGVADCWAEESWGRWPVGSKRMDRPRAWEPKEVLGRQRAEAQPALRFSQRLWERVRESVSESFRESIAVLSARASKLVGRGSSVASRHRLRLQQDWERRELTVRQPALQRRVVPPRLRRTVPESVRIRVPDRERGQEPVWARRVWVGRSCELSPLRQERPGTGSRIWPVPPWSLP